VGAAGQAPGPCGTTSVAASCAVLEPHRTAPHRTAPHRIACSAGTGARSPAVADHAVLGRAHAVRLQHSQTLLLLLQRGEGSGQGMEGAAALSLGKCIGQVVCSSTSCKLLAAAFLRPAGGGIAHNAHAPCTHPQLVFCLQKSGLQVSMRQPV